MKPQEYVQNLARMRAGLAIGDAAAQATGQIFLESMLSAIDPTCRLPLENFTWFRDIPKNKKVQGWVTNEIARNVDFRAQQTSSTGSDTNEIPYVTYNFNQDVWPVYPWSMRLRIPVIEAMRMAQVNESPQKLLDDGIRIHYSKTLDIRTYNGQYGAYGLVNQPQTLGGQPFVSQQMLPATGTSGGTTFASKASNPTLILQDFNFMANTIWLASGGAPGAMPNRFLVPSAVWDVLTNPMTIGTQSSGVAGGFNSILDYVKAKYKGSAFGVVPEIYPLPTWLDTAGKNSSGVANQTGRIVAYKFDEDCLSLSIPKELQRFDAPLSINSGAFEALYVANIGVVKVNRPTTIAYFDGAQ